MPAQIIERPKRRTDHAGDVKASAQILQFPSREGDLDPETAFDRIVGALTVRQSRTLALEIDVVLAAIAESATITAAPAAPPVNTPEGLRPRHSRRCQSRRGGSCDCDPSWEASVYSTVERRKIRRTFRRKQDALSWRCRHLGLADARQLRTPTRMTFGETGAAWVEMARAGEILNRSGRRYKPSALRTIEQDLRVRLIPALGPYPMSDIEKADLQHLVGAWLGEGLSASKIHGAVTAARVLWRDFDLITGKDNLLSTDPTRDLRLPAVTSKRDRIATPDESRRLILALKEEDRALWATALYAGVRHGELRALRVEDLGLPLKRIDICRGWDQYEGEIDPKSESGRRKTVIVGLLQELLEAHLARTGRTGSDLVFGRTPTRPFNTNTVNSKARKAWAAARKREDEEDAIPLSERIRPIGLHEARHTAVSQMLDAGITIDKVSKFMGHSSITVTIDRYGHLLPGGEAEAAALLDAYHERCRR
jgi:integrase